MIAGTVEVETMPDGTLVIKPCGDLGAEEAVGLRTAVVSAVRHARPLRLVLDLQGVRELDPINVGTLAAACHLGDDHRVAVFVHNASARIAGQLRSAGVAQHRLRHVGGQRAA